MAVPGKKPEAVEKRLKLFIYGGAGVGKTTACVSFPNVYYIDTEGGAQNSQYVELLQKNNSWYYDTNDFDDIIRALHALMREKHDFKTIVIDPLTTVYTEMVNAAELKVGNQFGRHYAEANKKMKHLMNLLIRLDMNVIITSHAKNEYGDNLAILGTTFDCYKKLDYLFDLMCEIQRKNNKIIGVVKKTRIQEFELNDQFDFNYEELVNRLSPKSLERAANSVEFATSEELRKLAHLIQVLQIDDETQQKWLSKAKSENFEEMPRVLLLKCLDHLEAKLTANEEIQS